MSCRVIKKQWHRFIYGLEHHNGLYWLNIFNRLAPPGAPPLPIPAGLLPAIPESIHAVQYAATQWLSMDDKSHANILADGSPVFSRNHTIKQTPHCPPGINVAVVSTIAFSTSTFKLGVSSVQGNGAALASTAFGPIFVTVECADPMSTPTGGGIAPGTVHISPTVDDWRQAAFEWQLAGVVEVFATFVFGKFMESRVGDFIANKVGGAGRHAHRWWTNRLAYDTGKQEVAQQAAREATEKLIRENGYDAFLSNEARRRGVNPNAMDDATKKAIDEAFEREVREAGENATVDAGEKGAGQAAKDATESWFEGQRKGGGPYSAPPNTQPSPTKAHGSKAEKAASELEKEILDQKNKDITKVPEAFGGDKFKSLFGDGTSEEIEDAAKEWSGVPETAE